MHAAALAISAVPFTLAGASAFFTLMNYCLGHHGSAAVQASWGVICAAAGVAVVIGMG
jgi:hypothetical protein